MKLELKKTIVNVNSNTADLAEVLIRSRSNSFRESHVKVVSYNDMAFVFLTPIFDVLNNNMDLPLLLDKTFSARNYTKTLLPKAEYNNCSFIDCDFSNADVSNISFLECEFIDCNFSNANIKHTTFNNVQFNNCKLLGLHFHDCNDFLLSFTFNSCSLNLASFTNLNIKDTPFLNCNLQQVDFTKTNISKAIFTDCDLKNAVFENTNLEKADLRSAINYSINPEINTINQAKFSKEQIFGLLNTYNIIIE